MLNQDKSREAVAAQENSFIMHSTMPARVLAIDVEGAIQAYRDHLEPPIYTTTTCTWCHEDMTRGLQPTAQLRALFTSLRDDAFFCDDDCLQEWAQEHIADILPFVERGRVEMLL